MRKFIRYLSAFMLLFITVSKNGQAQNIDLVLRDSSNNYFTIKQKAEAYFQRYGTVGTGYKEYKRWEFLVKNNIEPDGTLPDFTSRNQQALDHFTSDYGRPDAGVSVWSPVGQANPTILAGDNQNGSGSIRCVKPFGTDFWVGTAGGGMWYGDFVSGSTYNWSAKTDGIPNLSITDIVVAPTNSNIVYALTGAVGGASGYRSTGVIKSTDGGTTWATTGLTFPESGGVKGYRLIVDPTNSSEVWAATDNGLFHTADGGTTWAVTTYSTTVGGPQNNMSFQTFDIAYQPGSTTVMYAVGNNFAAKSTDGGLTFVRFNNVTVGLPNSGSSRISIGVTAANSNYLYLLYGNLSNSTYLGLYLSTNAGTSFTTQSTSPNVLGTQSWRNICIAVSPTVASDVYVGGLDIFKSTTSGSTWSQVSFWSTTSATLFSHADIFNLYCDATYLYAATDGGLYRMTRSTNSWVDLQSNMQIAQTYRLAVDPAAGFVTMGNQDNGSYKNTGAVYTCIGGGDGMETAIKPSNSNVIYYSSQNGSFARSDDGGSTSTGIFDNTTANATCGCSDGGNWTTPIVLRPGFDTHVYIGYRNIYYNTTSGTGAWSFISSGMSSGIESLEFAPNNGAILYATDGATVRRYNLSGAVWSGTTINGNLPAISNFTELAIDPNNSSHVVITVGGYTATQKVYETFNANVASPTWTSIVRNLPNVPVNCVTIDADAGNTIYLGTDIGVFATNDSRGTWLMYTNGLPTTRVYDLEINSTTSRIYAATFGRGVFYSSTFTFCQSTFNYTGSFTGLAYTEANLNITSTQSIWGGAGTSVAYNAGNYVLLNPGFEVKAGSTFNAYIRGCSGTPNPLRILPVVNNQQPLLQINPEGDKN